MVAEPKSVQKLRHRPAELHPVPDAARVEAEIQIQRHICEALQHGFDKRHHRDGGDLDRIRERAKAKCHRRQIRPEKINVVPEYKLRESERIREERELERTGRRRFARSLREPCEQRILERRHGKQVIREVLEVIELRSDTRRDRFEVEIRRTRINPEQVKRTDVVIHRIEIVPREHARPVEDLVNVSEERNQFGIHHAGSHFVDDIEDVDLSIRHFFASRRVHRVQHAHGTGQPFQCFEPRAERVDHLPGRFEILGEVEHERLQKIVEDGTRIELCILESKRRQAAECRHVRRAAEDRRVKRPVKIEVELERWQHRASHVPCKMQVHIRKAIQRPAQEIKRVCDSHDFRVTQPPVRIRIAEIYPDIEVRERRVDSIAVDVGPGPANHVVVPRIRIGVLIRNTEVRDGKLRRKQCIRNARVDLQR